MWELFKAGGWLMLPLFVCSIVTVAIVIERFIRLKHNMVFPKQLKIQPNTVPEIIERHLQHSVEDANSTLGRILQTALTFQHENDHFAKAQIEAVAAEEITHLERHINLLGTISTVSPLLGLLGTVIGIIESFLMVDMGSNASPTLMIPGISKALIATAMGMVVAIPALVAYRYFHRLVQEYVGELEQQATLFHAQLFYKHK